MTPGKVFESLMLGMFGEAYSTFWSQPSNSLFEALAELPGAAMPTSLIEGLPLDSYRERTSEIRRHQANFFLETEKVVHWTEVSDLQWARDIFSIATSMNELHLCESCD